MSKIAEQKALEAYPIKRYRIYYGLPRIDGEGPFTDDVNIPQRNAYIKGYDQAMKDFLEKAEEFFYEQFNIHPHDCHVVQYVSDTPLEDIDGFVEQFKNHMQDE